MATRRVSTSAPTSAETGDTTTASLHAKYRPSSLDQVVGQKAAVKSLRAALSARARPHSFLFSGPAGTGKTTLARIAMSECGVDASGLTSIVASVSSGVDDMRALIAPLLYRGFGEGGRKGILIDECHRLSKQAWDVLLEVTEEPPAHVYFALATTEPEKVPATIQTRFVCYHLKALSRDDIMDILEDACEAERYATTDKVLGLVADAAKGSGRAALTMLAKVHDASADDAGDLLEHYEESGEVIELCRLMVKGDMRWPDVVAALKKVGDVPAESVRIMVTNYLAACALGARSDKDAVRMLDMMACFSKPCQPTDKMAPLLLAFGRMVFPD